MDETSPEAGGRSNTWRTLTLDGIKNLFFLKSC